MLTTWKTSAVRPGARFFYVISAYAVMPESYWKMNGGEDEWWRELDLNQRSPKTSELQSDAFDRSAIPPL